MMFIPLLYYLPDYSQYSFLSRSVCLVTRGTHLVNLSTCLVICSTLLSICLSTSSTCSTTCPSFYKLDLFLTWPTYMTKSPLKSISG